MAYNNFYPATYQPFQYQQYQQYPQYQNFQQMPQQYQNNMQPQQPQQIQNGGFISVHNIQEAINYPVAPGNSVTFKDENSPYIYVKTKGFSQLEEPIFKKFRLIEENGFANVNTNVSNGFAGVNLGIANGTAAIQNSLCNGFNGVQQSVNGAQNALSQQMYTNQISDLERSFAAQTANTQGLTNLSAQLANCCCENRSATNDVKYTIATEACATRAANTANTQAILDKLCALELDGVKNQLAQAQRENIALQNAVNMATMQASQTAQTAQILAGQAAEIDGVYNRLKNCPVPSMPVYGNTPIFNCQSGGCGCGA